jgi:glycerophosphoryl diester phosphodiesterase
MQWQRAPGRPQVVAHRGASSTRAEHTLGAYRRALEEGAEGLECDVRLTADGHLVCVHDRRVDRTSTGQGVVSTLELADMDSFDWASWKHPWSDLDDEAPDLNLDERRVLTLRKLLETVVDWGKPMELFIETKHPNRYGALLEERLVELLDSFGMLDQRRPDLPTVRLMSFSRAGMRRFYALAPDLERIYLTHRLPAMLSQGILPPGVTCAGPSIDLLTQHPELVGQVHASGRMVYTWTVNDPAGFELCAALGVDFMATDSPQAALDYYDRR